tara:strand:+ start:91 stop:1116 length:1026 start_codon:yes stop_codon:yes gene_type:complete
MKSFDKQYFYDNYDKGRFPQFDDNIKIKSIKKEVLAIDDIDVDVFLDQIRVDDDIAKRARSLGASFESGIDWEQPLPIVKKRQNGSYSLVDAFGRFEMFEISNQKYWLMVVIECDTLAELQVRGWANRLVYRDPNKLKDNVELISTMVRKRLIKPTKGEYRKQINIIEPNKSSEEKDEIVDILVDKFGSTAPPKKKRFISRSATTLMKNWVNKHWASSEKIGFKLGSKGKPIFSKIGKCYYGVLQHGYEGRKILQAIRYNLKKDVPLKVVGISSGKITGEKKLRNERVDSKRKITALTNILDEFYDKHNGKPNWDEVFHHLGFVPESVNENQKELIRIGNK